MEQKKNVAPLVCGILGTIAGLIGGLLWVACADCLNDISMGQNTMWLALFIVFGLVGPVLGLIGGILAFGFKKAGGVLLLFATLFAIGHIVTTVYAMEGMFVATGEIATIIALLMFFIAMCCGFRSAPGANSAQPQQPYYGQYPQQGQPYYGQQPGQPYYGQQPGQPYYGQYQQPGQPYYGQPYYGQYQQPGQPYYGQPQQPVQAEVPVQAEAPVQAQQPVQAAAPVQAEPPVQPNGDPSAKE